MTKKPQQSQDDAFILHITDLLRQNKRQELANHLDQFQSCSDNTKSRVLFEISLKNDDDSYFALNHLVDLMSSDSPFKQTILYIMLDKSRSKPFFILPFIKHATLVQLKEAIPVFADILLNETDSYILQKVIFAIGETKEKSCTNVVADFIFYGHEELKREAIGALGKIGGASALERLEFASKTSKSDNYLIETLKTLLKEKSQPATGINREIKQFASRQDTLENLPENSRIAKLIHLLDSESPHDRHQAIDALIDIGPQAIPAVSGQINFDDPDSIINGLDILGNIGHEATLPSILKVLNLKHDDSNVRFAAFEAISKLPQLHTSISLFEGITDPSEQVRLAAATAINLHLSDIMVAGLKSKIETSGRQSQKNIITTAIIDSHSGRIFSQLMDSDSFVFNITEYLPQTHESTLSYFKEILIQRGRNALAESIRAQASQCQEKTRPLTIFCVDDSTICLKFYTKFFHTLGHNPYVFDRPENAITLSESSSPDLIVTDLNMLSMNGLQLAKEIRKSRSMDELPIIIVTTQWDFVRGFHKEADGMINQAIHKPLTARDIKPVLDSLSKRPNT